MPSGSEEPQRDPALKRKAWLAVFPSLPCFGWWLLSWPGNIGVNMAVTVRTETVNRCVSIVTMATKGVKTPATTVPASWKLTPQQAFIDVFAEDEPKKQ
jgi:hypothetical protein